MRYIFLLISSIFFMVMACELCCDHDSLYLTDSFTVSVFCFLLAILPLFVIDRRKLSLSFIDMLLCLLLALYALSAVINGGICSKVSMEELLPYLVLYLATRVFVTSGGRRARMVILSVFFLLSCRESIIGLLQIFGQRSSAHLMFLLTGSFQNPGPYGGFIAISTSMAAAFLISRRNRLSFAPARIFSLETLAAITLFLGLIVLPASMSRAAWLAFGLSVSVYIFVEFRLFRRLRQRWYLLALVLLVFSLFSCAAFVLKKDSALGRFHIWQIELRAIADASLSGTGAGTSLGAYGRAQEEYFLNSGATNDLAIKVAGSPEYAFNEYLKVGMEAGIVALLLCLAIVIVSIIKLLKKRSVFASGVIALSVFAFFSYPLSVTQLAFMAVILLAVSGSGIVSKAGHQTSRKYFMTACMALILAVPSAVMFIHYDSYKNRAGALSKWQSSRQWSAMELYEDSCGELQELYPILSWNYRYLYDYGYSLHKTGEYACSNEILHEGALLSSDPMFHNIIGKNYEAMGKYDMAESSYLKSHYMVPGRLYPLVLLMELYMNIGEEDKAMQIGHKILAIPVNEKNRSMMDLRQRAEENIY